MNEWVFASEWTPEEGKTVFVYGTHAVYLGGVKYSRENIAVGYYEDGKWNVYFPVTFRVIAWMAPVPPKKGGE
jgi:hypothetical protein